jgi:hypothetical protein
MYDTAIVGLLLSVPPLVEFRSSRGCGAEQKVRNAIFHEKRLRKTEYGIIESLAQTPT